MKRFSISLLSLFFSAVILLGQTAKEIIIENPRLAVGCLTPYWIHETPFSEAPDGYELFYVSHIGRHGSRFDTGSHRRMSTLKTLKSYLGTGVLTEDGDSLVKAVVRLHEVSEDNYGLLSDLGKSELRGIGDRLYMHSGSLFENDAIVTTYATSSYRVMQSRDALLSGLKDHNGDIVTVINDEPKSRSSKVSREVRGERMTEKQIDESSYSSFYRKTYKQLWKEFNTDAFASRMLNDTTAIKDVKKFMYDIYSCVFSCYSSNTHVFDLVDYFTPEELYYLWQKANIGWYGRSCVAPDEKPLRTLMMGGGIAREMISDADNVIAGRDRSKATLRFSHDTYVLPLLSFLNFEGVNYNSAEEVIENFRDYYSVCMGTNIQIFFYRNAAGRVLVKFLWNEGETRISGLEPVEGNYYDWNAVKAYYAQREKELKSIR